MIYERANLATIKKVQTPRNRALTIQYYKDNFTPTKWDAHAQNEIKEKFSKSIE